MTKSCQYHGQKLNLLNILVKNERQIIHAKGYYESACKSHNTRVATSELNFSRLRQSRQTTLPLSSYKAKLALAAQEGECHCTLALRFIPIAFSFAGIPNGLIKAPILGHAAGLLGYWLPPSDRQTPPLSPASSPPPSIACAWHTVTSLPLLVFPLPRPPNPTTDDWTLTLLQGSRSEHHPAKHRHPRVPAAKARRR